MKPKKNKRRKKLKSKPGKKQNPSRVLNEALTLYKSGKLKLALGKCQSVLADHPRHSDAFNLAGIIHMDLGQTEQSVNFMRSVVEILPDSSKAHFNLGTALTANGELTGAISSQRRALELKPDTNNLPIARQGKSIF